MSQRRREFAAQVAADVDTFGAEAIREVLALIKLGFPERIITARLVARATARYPRHSEPRPAQVIDLQAWRETHPRTVKRPLFAEPEKP